MPAVINVLPFESPAAVEPAEAIEIAHTLHEGAVVTITAPPILATLIERMAEGWNRDPNSHMAVEVGERRGGPGRVARDFTFRLRPDHWMASIAEGQGFGAEPGTDSRAPAALDNVETLTVTEPGIDINWTLTNGEWTGIFEANFARATDPKAHDRIQLRARVSPAGPGRFGCRLDTMDGNPPVARYISIRAPRDSLARALAYFEGTCFVMLNEWRRTRYQHWMQGEAHHDAVSAVADEVAALSVVTEPDGA